MLAFLFLAGLLCKVPILEKDLLAGAQSDQFGYLTEYKETQKKFPELTNQCFTVLRPINVAFKNKWLRDASRDLDKTFSLNLVNQ